jgi:hypothetical protein
MVSRQALHELEQCLQSVQIENASVDFDAKYQSLVPLARNCDAYPHIFELAASHAHPTIARYCVVLCCCLAGQMKVLFDDVEDSSAARIIDDLVAVERRYSSIGGILGYFVAFSDIVWKKMQSKEEKDTATQLDETATPSIAAPNAVPFTDGVADDAMHRLLGAGQQGLTTLGEVWMAGGSGDRLQFHTAMSLFPLGGRCVLDRLHRECLAREQRGDLPWGTIPVVVVLSPETESAVVPWLQENVMPYRPVKVIVHGMAPVLAVSRGSASGEFSLSWTRPSATASSSAGLAMKPGGHGMIWSAFVEEKCNAWFREKGVSHLLIRQVNNVALGFSNVTVALLGLCLQQNSAQMAFAGCERPPGQTEGVDVLRSMQNGSPPKVVNVEYTDFVENGLTEAQCADWNLPSHTNVIIIRLDAVLPAVANDSLPGRLINLKSGNCGRLECSMQAIAESSTIEEVASSFSPRLQTIIPCKRAVPVDMDLQGMTVETMLSSLPNDSPPIALWQLCRLQIERYHLTCPNVAWIDLHPAIPPSALQAVTVQKDSALSVDVVNASLSQVVIDGSLRIYATSYQAQLTAMVELSSVTVTNGGTSNTIEDMILHSSKQVERPKGCTIILGENSKVRIQKLALTGPVNIEVPPNSTVCLG